MKRPAYVEATPDPDAWLLEHYRTVSGVACHALLIPVAGQLQVELVTGRLQSAPIQLIERAVARNHVPSSIVTDNSLALLELRKWLLERGIAHSTSPKALAIMERLAPAIIAIAETLAFRACKNGGSNTPLTHKVRG
ncbi:hypothetical protein GCM10008171_28750 [Methylopila jiangsuensis]|uniref:Uncharacterized protein n=1 Tax=Methylopila jiangsuensis TaxID=586230 RepID=A0A9W6N4U9_9HYPH|nr:hypothetical protein GCM10008171_28750 [Methylopila jiangsuensis]